MAEDVTLTSSEHKSGTTLAQRACGSMNGDEYEFAQGQYLDIFDKRASGDLLYASKSPFLYDRFKYHDFASIPSCDLKYQCLPASCPSNANTSGRGPFYTARILPAKGPQQKSQVAWAGANTYCSARSV